MAESGPPRLSALAQFAGDLFVRLDGDPATRVRRLCCDGRDVVSGDLFFCTDAKAHELAPVLAERGAVAVCALAPTGAPVPELIVTDVRRAMGRIAAAVYGNPAEHLTLLGVTGTNGKTTTARALEAILAANGRSTGFIGSLSALIGAERRPAAGTTPEPPDLQFLLAQMQRANVDTVVLEVTSHGLALQRIEGMRFAAAAFTNLSPDHLDFHGDMDAYFAAKRLLFAPERAERAAVNVDDAHGRSLLGMIEIPALAFGLSREADLRAEKVRLGADGTCFRAITPVGTAQIATRLIGEFNIYNCLAAAAAALQVGSDLDAIESGLGALERVPGRFERIDAGQPFAAIVDFARTPAALEAALRAARLLAGRGNVICVLGCNGEAESDHRKAMGAVAATLGDHVVVTLDSPGNVDPELLVGDIADGAGAARADVDCVVLVNRAEAIARAVERARPGDAVLVVGRGAEPYHWVLGHPVPFDDREVTREALRACGWGRAGDRRPLTRAAAARRPVAPPAKRPKLVCLLPARDCVGDLPGYFESVERVADAVVALDDGSRDGTGEYLRTHPLVKKLLANPRRETYAGWDDGANRNRLLAAAAELQPDWILSLDADERIPADDAAALRGFLETDAVPGFGYSLWVFRMLGDEAHCDPFPRLQVPRLFAFMPGQRFPNRRLHLQPIPTSVPPWRWLETTLRIQHLASLTEERRRERFTKYRQADPEHEFQRSYRNLLAANVEPVPWEPRPPDLPVLAAEPGQDTLDADAPVVSAIVISRDDEDRIETVVRSVVEQDCPEPVEVIVVTSGTDRTAEIVRERFAQVRLIQLPRPALPGEARNAGLRVARGEYVSFPGSHVELPQGSLAARLRAHELGYAMVTGTTLNGTDTAAGWASYFLDHASRLPGRPSGELQGAPVTCSYERDSLLEIGGFPEDMRTGEDTVVNRELVRRGHVAYRAQDVVIVHHSRCRRALRLVLHHFQRGRGLGRIVLDDHRATGTAVLGAEGRPLLRGWLRRRISVTSGNVGRWGGEFRKIYRRVYPLVVAGAVAGWAGLWYELLRPQRGKFELLTGSRARSQTRARERYQDLAREIARAQGVPEDLFLALVRQESAWQVDAVSSAGALGLAQLMPATAEALGVDPWDPEENLHGGARYLWAQYERFGSWELALAAYNAGPDAVELYGDVPPFSETRLYVRSVLARADGTASAAYVTMS